MTETVAIDRPPDAKAAVSRRRSAKPATSRLIASKVNIALSVLRSADAMSVVSVVLMDADRRAAVVPAQHAGSHGR
jgi:hypothetical protein